MSTPLLRTSSIFLTGSSKFLITSVTLFLRGEQRQVSTFVPSLYEGLLGTPRVEYEGTFESTHRVPSKMEVGGWFSGDTSVLHGVRTICPYVMIDGTRLRLSYIWLDSYK